MPPGPTTADVLVIGGGIVGASIACALAAHRSVLLLEAEDQPGRHATGRSAALFTEAYGPPLVRALTRASRAFFNQPPAGFASIPLLQPRGTLYVAPAGQRGEVLRLHRQLAAEGVTSQLLDGAEARARVPALRPEACAAALLDEDAFDIEVDALLQGYLRLARSQGAGVLTDAGVAGLAHHDGRWQVRCTDGRQFSAGVVVNAAGAWADQVAQLAGARPIGLQPRRRSAFLFDAPAGLHCRDWPAVIAMDETWYFKPDAGLLLGSPANADPAPPHDVRPEELDIALAIHRINEATTLDIQRPRSTWAGLRSFVPDGEPVCGFDATLPGFFWAAALGGYGIQSSPAVGQLCAALLCSAPLPEHLRAQGVDAHGLSPGRA